jgi:hypothetical protein
MDKPHAEGRHYSLIGGELLNARLRIEAPLTGFEAAQGNTGAGAFSLKLPSGRTFAASLIHASFSMRLAFVC